ncbi:MAG: glycerol-3-phosphate dehydrogenase subunit GlpB [Desulfobacterales bacterium]|jgi:glycerol-3-phosphate dehydrogenase subunit B|nr:glycerol-3-phosphate dehydrogenase subunit GlpB [Desulfobacteraceae bacterium]MBT4364629.1 glycerol-3-phosphate dehydrogenase subunit GlpB [Desulfobacteraceae bacterium]MBT7084754.1 glycerol-3-phosphate dehydrogenase subunit GlpB [Desulfobacterales bacterium]MBT7697912.1 glycerol-3-phosphate dehydrogenase subunit GlpB [Desulfobacterales bacterium]
MNYDCIIIGGGISGLSCGIKCLSEGLSCALISTGMSALHFSSGSIDLLSYYPEGKVVKSPFKVLEEFTEKKPFHPYTKCSTEVIKEAILFFQKETSKEDLQLISNSDKNHFHVTTLGTIKPTFLSQKSVFNNDYMETFPGKTKIALITFKGFRDFYPAIAADNLTKHKLFKDSTIITGEVELPEQEGINKHEFRSIDIGRIFDSMEYIEQIANSIKVVAGDAEFVGMPAFIGINDFNTIHNNLCEMTGKHIYEIPTLPPSLLGIRLDSALKSRFTALGGIFIPGDKVEGGKITNNKVDYIYTRNLKGIKLKAKNFVLTTGSFFSGGLTADFNMIKEPVFNLKIDYPKDRSSWRSKEFFHNQGHPFLNFGVKTNSMLNPFTSSGSLLKNLFCTGALLAGYDPIKEGTGSGVAISTGFYAAKQITKK